MFPPGSIPFHLRRGWFGVLSQFLRGAADFCAGILLFEYLPGGVQIRCINDCDLLWVASFQEAILYLEFFGLWIAHILVFQLLDLLWCFRFL